MSIIDLIANDSYIMCNKTIAKEYGINEAILLGSLCSLQKRYGNEEFYFEQPKLMEDTCLTEYSIRQATKVLKEAGIISVVKKGLPAKHYYKVNEQVLYKVLCLSTSGVENATTGDNENATTINNKNIINKNIINNKKEECIDEILSKVDNERLKITLTEFLKHRKAIKKPMTTYALKLLIEKMNKISANPERQIQLLQKSIERGWQSVYDENSDSKKTTDYDTSKYRRSDG